MKCHEGPKGERGHRRHGKKRRMMARRRRMMEMMAAGGLTQMGGGPGWGRGPDGRGPGRKGPAGRHRHQHQRSEGTHFQDRMKKDDAISMLEDLVAGLKSGTLQIENGEDQVILKPAGKVEVHVRTHQTDNAEVIGLRLKWRRKDGSKLAGFRIGSGSDE